MAFVADDLAAWLIGLLADPGRRRLTTVLLGTDQEGALRSAATAVVELGARELRPENDEQAEQVALVISRYRTHRWLSIRCCWEQAGRHRDPAGCPR